MFVCWLGYPVMNTEGTITARSLLGSGCYLEQVMIKWLQQKENRTR